MRQLNKRDYWLCALLWVVCIYSTLYAVRPICDYLSKIMSLSLLVNSLIIAVLVFVCVFKIRMVSFKNLVWILLILSGYAVGLYILKLPAERVHFLEYGFLAFLIFKALRFDCPKGLAFFCALIFCTLIGWGDEGIQGLLPNRYYELRDVGLNAISSFLGLLLTMNMVPVNKDKKMLD